MMIFLISFNRLAEEDEGKNTVKRSHRRSVSIIHRYRNFKRSSVIVNLKVKSREESVEPSQ